MKASECTVSRKRKSVTAGKARIATCTRAELIFSAVLIKEPRSAPSLVLPIPGNRTTVHSRAAAVMIRPQVLGCTALWHHSNLLLSLQLGPGFPGPSGTTASPLRGV